MLLEMGRLSARSQAPSRGLLNPRRPLFHLRRIVLGYSTLPMFQQARRRVAGSVVPDDALSHGCAWQQLLPRRATASALIPYQVTRVPLGFGLMYVAGSSPACWASAAARSRCRRWTPPCACRSRSRTATSNFMIGVTAAASAGIYFCARRYRPAHRRAGRARRAGRRDDRSEAARQLQEQDGAADLPAGAGYRGDRDAVAWPGDRVR